MNEKIAHWLARDSGRSPPLSPVPSWDFVLLSSDAVLTHLRTQTRTRSGLRLAFFGARPSSPDPTDARGCVTRNGGHPHPPDALALGKRL